ncbi:MAG TPA: hypothetical protein VK633_06165, partial [Verrucomicrobiae bacterium]|nr:hypothetical protein [Verrucomicrobiae bacterium]
PYTLVHAAKSFKDEESFRRALSQGFEYGEIAAYPEDAGKKWAKRLSDLNSAPVASPPAGDLLQPISNTPNLFAVEANASRPGVLIFNQRWSKDWHARVNSAPEEVMRVDFTHVGVFLPAGRNYVEFEYKPILFWRLLLLQRATFIAVLLVAGWKMARSRRLLPVGIGKPACGG